jgi:hypothetical protein
MASASAARRPWPRRSRACRRSLGELVKGALHSGALRISVVLFDELCLLGRSDLADRLERLIDGPFPRGVVDHVASIRHGRLRLLARPGTRARGHRAVPGPPQRASWT